MIVWLASYPKSGNTWLRIFLAQLIRDGAPVSINDIRFGAIASSREAFDASTGFDSSLLTADEIETLRREVYLDRARENSETLYCKVHDAFVTTPAGQPLFPKEVTESVVYLVRDPRDVAVSLAHHANQPDFDVVIDWMNNPNYCLADERDRQAPQLRQRLLTWSQHVTSWMGSGLPTLIVRYEDLVNRPQESFGNIVDFLHISATAQEITHSIEGCDFNRLRAEEQKAGFTERPPRSTAFFREGKAGSWRGQLSNDQATTIARQHAATIRRLGYDETTNGNTT